MLRFSIFTFMILLFFNTNAATPTPRQFPRGCEITGFGYSNNFLILNEKGEQTLYLIQNRSDQQIELERHNSQDAFMSPKLQSKLDPSSWAAFASDIGNMLFKCYNHAGNNTAQINCSDVLDVCQYPRVKFAISNMGNYWISTNKPQEQVIKDAIAKGIYLRW